MEEKITPQRLSDNENIQFNKTSKKLKDFKNNLMQNKQEICDKCGYLLSNHKFGSGKCPEITIEQEKYCEKCGHLGEKNKVFPCTCPCHMKTMENKPGLKHTCGINQKECNCEEMSCKEGCKSNHTHKGFWCEKCHPERYEETKSEQEWEARERCGEKPFDVITRFREKFPELKNIKPEDPDFDEDIEDFLLSELSRQREEIVEKIELIETTLGIRNSDSYEIGKNHGRQEYKQKLLELFN